jgi:hypothetical protein
MNFVHFALVRFKNLACPTGRSQSLVYCIEFGECMNGASLPMILENTIFNQ